MTKSIGFTITGLVAFLLLGFPRLEAQEDLEFSGESTETQTQLFNNFSDATSTSNSVLVLIPSSLNVSDLQLNTADFNLFKLNTNILFNNQNRDEGPEDEKNHAVLQHRESRRLNILRGMWNKPRASPLYLINGTVCRFVNSLPICTTLATTGLLPSGGSSSSASGGGGARPAANQFSGGGSAVQFANQQQSPRPAALIDEDPQMINVESSVVYSNTSDNNSTNLDVRRQPVARPLISAPLQAGRPNNLLVNRRPLNFLALRRPIRGYQAQVKKRA